MGQVITFLILLFLLKRYVYGPITGLMDQRAEKIAQGLNQADEAKRRLQEAEIEAAELAKAAKTKALEILNQAEKSAGQLREESVAKAREEAEGIVAAAREEIAAEVQKARGQLQAELADMIVLGASRILEAELDAERHKAVIGDVISRMEH
ncbi:MAG: ATP synthase F0 subunit B [Alphaproteobacteria bacterium CG_4_10_14_0_2_um_filter_63_37]|nr:MAG: ATP synthase F0 subunit B [Alphaproteobacteria bacterium CG_4_10_14_0_2_um_filter_63_37]